MTDRTDAPAPLPASAADERDGRGRFKPGNKAAKGNKAAQTQARMLAAIRGAVSERDLAAVLRKMRDSAKAGDTAAAQILLNYCLGRPRERQPAIDIPLPRLDTARGVRDAMTIIAGQAAAGLIRPDDAAAIAGLVTATAEANALVALEARLQALEEARREIA